MTPPLSAPLAAPHADTTLPGTLRLALFEQPFRPLFLAAGLHAAVVMVLWLHMLSGAVTLPLGGPFAGDPIAWHGHEMIAGFLGAALGGFLLTAMAMWTGRPAPGPLANVALLATWLTGRLATTLGADLPMAAVGVLDALFPALVLVLAGHCIIGSKNWRNAKVLVLVALWSACVLTPYLTGDAVTANRAGLLLSIVMITLIGGRIIPLFTANWLRRTGRLTPGQTPPAPFGKFDAATIAVTALAAVLVLTSPAWLAGEAIAAALIAAGLANAVRLVRWRGWRAAADPLVWILHVAYAWIPLGLIALGLAVGTTMIGESEALHLLGAGAMASMILAVMPRVTMGHSGRALVAPKLVIVAFLALQGAVILRVLPEIAGGWETGVAAAAVLFVGAFALFVVRIGPWLAVERR